MALKTYYLLNLISIKKIASKNAINVFPNLNIEEWNFFGDYKIGKQAKMSHKEGPTSYHYSCAWTASNGSHKAHISWKLRK